VAYRRKKRARRLLLEPEAPKLFLHEETAEDEGVHT